MKCPICGCKDWVLEQDPLSECGHGWEDIVKYIERLKSENKLLDDLATQHKESKWKAREEKADLQVQVRRWKRQYEAVKQEYKEYREDSK